MSRFKLKQLVKKKSILLTLLIVFSLLISGKASDVYDKKCCLVNGVVAFFDNTVYIIIIFKFFEYEKLNGINNSYLKKFEVHYSTDDGKIYTHLISASTENQYSKDWAWIDFKYKKATEKIYVFWQPRIKSNGTSSLLLNNSKQRLEVANKPSSDNETWCEVNWYPEKFLLNKITRIQIIAKWYNPIIQKTEDVLMVYNVK